MISQANLVLPAFFAVEPISSIEAIFIILFETPELTVPNLYFLLIADTAYLFGADFAALRNFKALRATDLSVF
jgi:hypothetical protein